MLFDFLPKKPPLPPNTLSLEATLFAILHTTACKSGCRQSAKINPCISGKIECFCCTFVLNRSRNVWQSIGGYCTVKIYFVYGFGLVECHLKKTNFTPSIHISIDLNRSENKWIWCSHASTKLCTFNVMLH